MEKRFSNLEKWKKKYLIATVVLIFVISATFLIGSGIHLINDKNAEDNYWQNTGKVDPKIEAFADDISKDAINVTTGQYIETVKEFSIRDSKYRYTMMVWFKWNGNNNLDMANHFRIYQGTINCKEMVKDYHKGDVNYQSLRVDVTIAKDFWTTRFPLESHQLKAYLESDYTIDKVKLIADKKYSSYNNSLDINGFKVKRYKVESNIMQYDNIRNDPELKDINASHEINSEVVSVLEINRANFGLYLICTIALMGTCLWAIIALYICSHHSVDPLSMLPGALFGAVSNIMVGVNMLPQTLNPGLILFINVWGIGSILATTISIININHIRNDFGEEEFANEYGSIVFNISTVICIIGFIVLPLCAYLV